MLSTPPALGYALPIPWLGCLTSQPPLRKMVQRYEQSTNPEQKKRPKRQKFRLKRQKLTLKRQNPMPKQRKKERHFSPHIEKWPLSSAAPSGAGDRGGIGAPEVLRKHYRKT